MTDSNMLRRMLENSRSVAVVGMSNKVHRPSYFVGKYLLDHGYTVYPVNPSFDEVLGLKAYSTLEEIPEPVDIVDCFRRSDQMLELAKSAVAINAKVLWMQLGIVNEEAQLLAENAGLDVVVDRCTKIEHARLFGGLNWAGVNTGIISSRRPKKINL